MNYNYFKIWTLILLGPPSSVFYFSTSAYFVNGSTQLMSDVTDNQFYPSAERILLYICACDRLTEDADFDKKKKIIFSDEAHFDLGGYVNKQSCSIWGTENPHAYIENPTHNPCGFWSRGIIGPFFFENEQGKAVIVDGER